MTKPAAERNDAVPFFEMEKKASRGFDRAKKAMKAQSDSEGAPEAVVAETAQARKAWQAKRKALEVFAVERTACET